MNLINANDFSHHQYYMFLFILGKVFKYLKHLYYIEKMKRSILRKYFNNNVYIIYKKMFF